MTPIEITTLVLSLVALIITVIGFFASLKFYRDGVEMNNQSRDALAKIEEKAASIHTQVGGMFDKTLDAALGRPNLEDASKQQAEQQDSSDVSSEKSVKLTGVAGLNENGKNQREPAVSVDRYFAFKGCRFTTLEDETSKAVFNLSAGYGFNLFDGDNKIIFFGYFHELDATDIVFRTRNLFSNINISYERLKDNPDVSLVESARRVLDQISLELLIPADTDLKKLRAKIMEYQPANRKIMLTFHTVDDIKNRAEEEYRKMKP
ncbi:MAG: hypothetical protein ACYST3_07145 [Planctomycetota bacterium]|jgi:hypothetical protein